MQVKVIGYRGQERARARERMREGGAGKRRVRGHLRVKSQWLKGRRRRAKGLPARGQRSRARWVRGQEIKVRVCYSFSEQTCVESIMCLCVWLTTRCWREEKKSKREIEK